METIYVAPHDEVHNIVTASDAGIEREISNHFTFFVDGYKFMEKYKSGMWDGKIRIYNTRKNLLYVGLTEKLIKFAKERGYNIKVQEREQYPLNEKAIN